MKLFTLLKAPWRNLSALVIPMLLALSAFSQSNLYQTAVWNVSSLDQSQLEGYNKVLNSVPANQIFPIEIGNLGALQSGGRIKVTLPESICGETIFRAKHSEYESESNYTWYAEIEPPDTFACSEGYMLIKSRGGRRFGEIKIEHDFYAIEDFGGINAAVKLPVLNEESGVCGGGVLPEEEEINEEDPIEIRTEENCDVRVLVLFTPSAETRVANIQESVQLLIAQANQAFRNSSISGPQLTVTLAAAEEIAIDETGETIRNILFSLRADATAQARRNFHDADVVMLLVNKMITDETETAAGIAFLGPFNQSAYGVARINQRDIGFVFAHELGHIFGANHEPCDAEDAGTNCEDLGTIEHAHTWTFERPCGFLGLSRCPVKRRTIMYSSGAGSTEVIPFFSNPDVFSGNHPTGIANERDNARLLRGNACTIANFRGATDELIVRILGENYVCPTSFISLNASVSGIPGPYSYEWSTTLDGVNWTVVSTASFLSINGWEYNVGDFIYIRLKVTTNTQTATWWHSVDIVDTGYNTLCLRGGEINDSYNEGVVIFPNPASNMLYIRYSLMEALKVEIRLFDLSGKLVKALSVDKEAGNYTDEIGLENLPSGMYILQFMEGKRMLVSKLVKG